MPESYLKLSAPAVLDFAFMPIDWPFRLTDFMCHKKASLDLGYFVSLRCRRFPKETFVLAQFSNQREGPG